MPLVKPEDIDDGPEPPEPQEPEADREALRERIDEVYAELEGLESAVVGNAEYAEEGRDEIRDQLADLREDVEGLEEHVQMLGLAVAFNGGTAPCPVCSEPALEGSTPVMGTPRVECGNCGFKEEMG